MKYPSINSDLIYSYENIKFYSHSNLSKKFIKDNINESLINNSSIFLNSFINQEPVNFTENRSALHFCPRYYDKNSTLLKSNIYDDLNVMFKCSELINSSEFSNITDIIHLGTGGSYLGPKLIHECFSHLLKGPKTHFISNIDPLSLNRILLKLKPQNTLIIFISKSFSTHETQLNLMRLKSWFFARGFSRYYYKTSK